MEFDELLEHLRDLEGFARTEGFIVFAGLLRVPLWIGEEYAEIYGVKGAAPDPPATRRLRLIYDRASQQRMRPPAGK